jgi:prolyl 4-hydroxylase
LEERWPLYVEDIFGEAHQVNLEPGEFLFYEGARLIHGRPWPLKGDYYIGMFVHYRPVEQEL